MQVDIAVIEVGLGGARDATNVIPPEQLQAAVITAVGDDHREALGGSMQSIAAAKAGIIKTGRPTIIAKQPHAEAKEVLLQKGAWGCMKGCCSCSSWGLRDVRIVLCHWQ